MTGCHIKQGDSESKSFVCQALFWFVFHNLLFMIACSHGFYRLMKVIYPMLICLHKRTASSSPKPLFSALSHGASHASQDLRPFHWCSNYIQISHTLNRLNLQSRRFPDTCLFQLLSTGQKDTALYATAGLSPLKFYLLWRQQSE